MPVMGCVVRGVRRSVGLWRLRFGFGDASHKTGHQERKCTLGAVWRDGRFLTSFVGIAFGIGWVAMKWRGTIWVVGSAKMHACIMYVYVGLLRCWFTARCSVFFDPTHIDFT